MSGIPVSDLMEFYSFVYLGRQGFARGAVCRMECRIVAVGAAACAGRPVPVRTGETGVEDDFLQSLAVHPAEVSYE